MYGISAALSCASQYAMSRKLGAVSAWGTECLNNNISPPTQYKVRANFYIKNNFSWRTRMFGRNRNNRRLASCTRAVAEIGQMGIYVMYSFKFTLADGFNIYTYKYLKKHPHIVIPAERN